MIRTWDELLTEVEVSSRELTVCIEQRWVLPTQQDGAYLFNEADVARVQLIVELRRDLMVNDDAIPVVLSLLDQVYALRHALAEVNDAIKSAPPQVREEITQRLRSSS